MCVDLSSSNRLNFQKCTRKCCVDTNTFYCAIFRLSTPFGKSNLRTRNQISQKWANMLSCPRYGTGNLKEGRSFTCILPNSVVVQHCCVMHSQAYCNWNAVMNRCCPNRHAQHFNNKSEHSIQWHLMCLFLQETHYIVFPHCIINLQHNPNLNTQMLITMILTLTIPHQNHLQINLWIMVMQFKFLSLENAPFSKIQYGFRLILLFEFIWCLKWMNTKVMIWTCSMKS
jgi:hypothetical protein